MGYFSSKEALLLAIESSIASSSSVDFHSCLNRTEAEETRKTVEAGRCKDKFSVGKQNRFFPYD